jgi:hypothetical protein
MEIHVYYRQFQVILQELRLAIDWGFIESIQDTFADLMPTEATEVSTFYPTNQVHSVAKESLYVI